MIYTVLSTVKKKVLCVFVVFLTEDMVVQVVPGIFFYIACVSWHSWNLSQVLCPKRCPWKTFMGSQNEWRLKQVRIFSCYVYIKFEERWPTKNAFGSQQKGEYHVWYIHLYLPWKSSKFIQMYVNICKYTTQCPIPFAVPFSGGLFSRCFESDSEGVTFLLVGWRMGRLSTLRIRWLVTPPKNITWIYLEDRPTHFCSQNSNHSWVYKL